MSDLIKQACEHWRYVAPLPSTPTSEDEYNALVGALDELLSLVGDDEFHPLAGLASCSGLLIPDTDLGENPRHQEVFDEQATTYVFRRVQT